MSDYLSNLISQHTVGQVRGGLRPFVRSQSPIAELDQRIGMPGFEAFELGRPEQTAGDLLSSNDGGDASSPPKISPASSEGVVQRKMEVSAPTSPAPSPAIVGFSPTMPQTGLEYTSPTREISTITPDRSINTNKDGNESQDRYDGC